MKPILLLFVLIVSNMASAQQQVRPCDTAEGKQLDFWLGEWDLTWPADQMGGEKGEIGHGRNTITTILDDCIIQEEFRTADGSFKGRSVSVYNPREETWQQTWVDSQGGYLLFTGEFADGKMILRTAPKEREGKTVVSRMVFRNITETSLDWDWQRSTDAGQTWVDLWNIHYERKDDSD